MNTTEIERIVMRLGEKRKLLEDLLYNQYPSLMLSDIREKRRQELKNVGVEIQDEERKLEAAILAATKEIQDVHRED